MAAGALLAASAAALAVGIWSRGDQAVSTPVTIIDGTEPTDGSSSQAGSIAAPEAAEASDPPGAVTSAARDTAADAGPAADADTTAAAGPDPPGSVTAADAGSAVGGNAAAAAGPAAYPAPMVPGILDRGSGTGPDRVGGSAGVDPISVPSGSPPALTADSADRGRPEDPAGHEAGAVLEHGGYRYGVGAPGDFVQTGDWDCDGQATPAIVRPSTGHVVLFDAWPAPDQSISMPVRWQVEAPTGAEAVSHGSCDLLRVYTTAGSKLFDPSEGQ